MQCAFDAYDAFHSNESERANERRDVQVAGEMRLRGSCLVAETFPTPKEI